MMVLNLVNLRLRLRKMTTWYCNKMMIGKDRVLTCCSPKGQISLLQKWRLWFFSRPFNYRNIETWQNEIPNLLHPFTTKCRAHPHFKTLFSPRTEPSYGAQGLPVCAGNWNGAMYVYVYNNMCISMYNFTYDFIICVLCIPLGIPWGRWGVPKRSKT